MKTSKKTPINEKTPINSFKIDKENSTIIINDEIRLVFLNLYHFNLALKVQERMLDSNVKRATGKDMNIAIRQVEKDISPKVKRIKTFKPFCNFWKSGCTNKHINTNYFRVERLDNSLVGDPSDEKKEGLKEDRRRLFLKKIFLHNNKAEIKTSQFWLAISEQQEKSWRIQYKEKLLDELNNDESLKDGRFIRLGVKKNVVDDSDSNERQQSSFVNKDIINLLNSLGDNLKLVIVGEAGAGKSTTLKYFFKERLLNLTSSNNAFRLPVFVSLVRLKENQTLESLIMNSIQQHTKNLPSNINIYKDFLLIFDGLDEITNHTLQSDTLAELHNIFSNTNSNVILSCRSNNYHNDLIFFPCYELQELSAELIIFYLTSFFDKDAVNIFETKIKSDNNLLSMARIPFLLNIITEHIKIAPNKSIPPNKGLLIKEFLNKIINKKPRKDIKAKPIASHDKSRFLGILAYYMVCANEENGEYSCSLHTRNKAEDIWNKTMSKVKSTDILLRAEKERILKSGSTYENPVFAHSLIRDYFVAYHIINSAYINEKNIVKEIRPLLEYKKWDNAISLLIGLLEKDKSEDVLNLLAEVAPHFCAECFWMASNPSPLIEQKLADKATFTLKTAIEINFSHISFFTIFFKSKKLSEALIASKVQESRDFFKLRYYFAWLDLPQTINILLEQFKNPKLFTYPTNTLLETKHSLENRKNISNSILKLSKNDPTLFKYEGFSLLGYLNTNKGNKFLKKCLSEANPPMTRIKASLALGISNIEASTTFIIKFITAYPKNIETLNQSILSNNATPFNTTKQIVNSLEDFLINFVKNNNFNLSRYALGLLTSMHSKKIKPFLQSLSISEWNKLDIHDNLSIYSTLHEPDILRNAMNIKVENHFLNILADKKPSVECTSFEGRDNIAEICSLAAIVSIYGSQKAFSIANKILNEVFCSYTGHLCSISCYMIFPLKLEEKTINSLLERVKVGIDCDFYTQESMWACLVLRHIRPNKTLEILINRIETIKSNVSDLTGSLRRVIPYCNIKTLETSVTKLLDIFEKNKTNWRGIIAYENITHIENILRRRFLLEKHQCFFNKD